MPGAVRVPAPVSTDEQLTRSATRADPTRVVPAPTGPKPLGLRELAMGAAGASLGAVLVLIGVAVALGGAWAALTGSDLWFWSWAEPAPVTAGALVVVGLPVAVYVACTIWLCVLFVPLLTFRLVRGLLGPS